VTYASCGTNHTARWNEEATVSQFTSFSAMQPGNQPIADDSATLERFICSRRPSVRVLARPSLQSHNAVILNISRRGIGLLIGQRFEPGSLLAIQLRHREVGISGILTATVKHATEQPPGNWSLGCSLSRSLTDDEIAALI